ncbi:MAG TPA: immunoglobulin-like domain-containing protein [Solirubrobacterales bacterium]|nr:immunoglobulin-like domain-containing protein [Solirubrobacterales bacterium]
MLAVLIGAAPSATAAEPETPEPRFCHRHVLHDYLAPLAGLPKLREPPFRRTGRFIRFHGATIAASGPTLAVSGGSAGFQIDWDRNPRWELTLRLARVDWQGRVMRWMGERRIRTSDLGQALITEPEFLLHGRPALYRTTLVIRSRKGRELGQFGNYYRVIRPTMHGRLALGSDTYAPGSTLFARIENPGASFILFGAEFRIERLNRGTWGPAPEAPDVFPMPLYFVAPGTTSNHCTVFPIPSPASPGRYRLSQEAIFSWPLQEHELRPTLHAGFTVTPAYAALFASK